MSVRLGETPTNSDTETNHTQFEVSFFEILEDFRAMFVLSFISVELLNTAISRYQFWSVYQTILF